MEKERHSDRISGQIQHEQEILFRSEDDNGQEEQHDRRQNLRTVEEEDLLCADPRIQEGFRQKLLFRMVSGEKGQDLEIRSF